jgi:hypothetical protein
MPGATPIRHSIPPDGTTINEVREVRIQFTEGIEIEFSRIELEPAEGASVTLISPRRRQVFKGHPVPVTFNFAKGKRGEHVHAHVDGEVVGMFKSEKGTLTGTQSGKHILEFRAVARDHQTELDATATVELIVQ